MQALSRGVRQNASVTPTSPHLPAPSGVGDTLPGDPTLGPLAAIFRARVERWWPDLIDALEALYGTEIGAATAAELLAIAPRIAEPAQVLPAPAALRESLRLGAARPRPRAHPPQRLAPGPLDDRLRGIHRADGR